MCSIECSVDILFGRQWKRSKNIRQKSRVTGLKGGSIAGLEQLAIDDVEPFYAGAVVWIVGFKERQTCFKYVDHDAFEFDSLHEGYDSVA